MHECGGTSQPGITGAISNHPYDVYVHQFGDHFRTCLWSNDGILGNADDRRAYLRLGMNVSCYKIPVHDIFSSDDDMHSGCKIIRSRDIYVIIISFLVTFYSVERLT